MFCCINCVFYNNFHNYFWHVLGSKSVNGHQTDEALPSSPSPYQDDSDAPTVLLPPYYDTIYDKNDDDDDEQSEFNNLEESEVRR